MAKREEETKLKEKKKRSIVSKFFEADLLTHIIFASVFRLSLICYGEIHDSIFEVPYTDIDYKVFTDAARHIVNGNSPYKRHTFRYSPLIAFLLTPNIFCHPVVGKIIFCEADLIVAYLIFKLVYLNVCHWFNQYGICFSKESPPMTITYMTKKNILEKRKGRLGKMNVKIETSSFWAQIAMLTWLYNPMTIAISTRGNSDSLSCLLVISTLYCIQAKSHPFIVGLVHGLAIHFRIYPLIYSFLYYMHFSSLAYYFEQPKTPVHSQPKKLKKNMSTKIVQNKRNKVDTNERNGELLQFFKGKIWQYLWPNTDQVMLIIGTLTSLLGLTGLFYHLYGYTYLYESILYHFVRKDFKHNFSLYFYLQYLTSFVQFSDTYTSTAAWLPILVNLPPIILILYFSIQYGLNKFSLNFGVLVTTIVFVIYNKVITSQYFVWIIGLIPLCLWQINLSTFSIISMIGLWFVAQAAWLFPAYLLEFQGDNTFLYIWIQGVSLFCAHIAILGRLIKNFILPVSIKRKCDGKISE